MFNLLVAATLVVGAGTAGAVTLPPEVPDAADEQVADLILVELPPIEESVPGEAPPEEELREEPPEEGEGAEEEGASASAHGKAVSEVARDDSLQGCERGQAVAAIASSKSQGHRQDETDRPDPCSRGNHGNGEGPPAFVLDAGHGPPNPGEGGGESSMEGPPDSAGPPDHAGPPDSAGPADHAGPPEGNPASGP